MFKDINHMTGRRLDEYSIENQSLCRSNIVLGMWKKVRTNTIKPYLRTSCEIETENYKMYFLETDEQANANKLSRFSTQNNFVY